LTQKLLNKALRGIAFEKIEAVLKFHTVYQLHELLLQPKEQ
jgi:hypothetical protein